jgi:hypothetical protein
MSMKPGTTQNLRLLDGKLARHRQALVLLGDDQQ